MSVPLRLLLLEDSEKECLRIVEVLRAGGFDPVFERVDSLAMLAPHLDLHLWDVIIGRDPLPKLHPAQALSLCHESGVATPFIVVSSSSGPARAVEIMKAGADDYILWRNLDQLPVSVSRLLREAGRQRARRRQEVFWGHVAAIVENCDDAIFSESLDGMVQSWNPAAERLHGYAAGEMIGRSILTIVPPYRPDELPGIHKRIARGEHIERLETVRVRKDGTPVDVSLTISPIRDEQGRIIGASTVERDITARRAEEQERIALIQELTEALARANEHHPGCLCPTCRKHLDHEGAWRSFLGETIGSK